MAQSPCRYPVEPTDEEENLERWFAFIEGLPDEFERDSLRYLWNQPPTSWTFTQYEHYADLDITVSGGNGVSGWIKNLRTRVAMAELPEPKTLGVARAQKQRHGVWTIRDPNQDLRRRGPLSVSNQQEALVEPRILLYCFDDITETEFLRGGWMPQYPAPTPSQQLDHEHSWDCIQQIWVS